MTDDRIREVVSAALTELGRKEVSPKDVPTAHVQLFRHLLNTGTWNFDVSIIPEDLQPALIRAILGASVLADAMTQDERVFASQLLKGAARATQAESAAV